ncbi:MAG: murein DD-endopeptidase MepM/ murein hydrolase activator NlpD [Arenicella sp.]|jgi:murein DD-endopeptidase MepM/ murein hydrolase activator NlpD
MLLLVKTFMLETLTRIFQPKTNTGDSNKPQIRKRHWALGSMVILGGSWITHTTTATIAIPQSISSITAIDSTESLTIQAADRLTGSLITESEQGALIAVKSLPTDQAVLPMVSKEKLTSIKHMVKKGESLGIIFRRKSINLSLPYKISQHETAKKLVSLSIGKELEFKFDATEQLRELSYPIGALERLTVEFSDNKIVAAHVESLPFITQQKTVSAEIESSLYLSALSAGLSNNLIMEMVRIFGWDVDFVLDIRKGDSFHVIYTEYYLDDKKLSDGDILAAEFTTQGQIYRAIRFEDDNGDSSFYTPEGESMLGTFLRSPVEFSRISSRFGKRKHPISKKWKTHKGVDYAASRGTPIRATADGKVLSAGRKGGYGKTVVLSHAGRFSTLYAHMNGFAKNVRSGSRVKQGQIIGYVGTTGYSTGPHLHYEFRVDGVHRNSLTYKTPKASSIDEQYKAEFDLHALALSDELNKVQNNYQLAKLSYSAESQDPGFDSKSL